MQTAPLIMYPNRGKYDASWLKTANCHCPPLINIGMLDRHSTMYMIHRQWTVHVISIISCTKNSHLHSYSKVCTLEKCQLKFCKTITSINSTV